MIKKSVRTSSVSLQSVSLSVTEILSVLLSKLRSQESMYTQATCFISEHSKKQGLSPHFSSSKKRNVTNVASVINLKLSIPHLQVR